MGNNGSRTGNVTQRQSLEVEQRWAHSFPRNSSRVYQHKVLPERDANKKLRSTGNGEILHSGGTLSGRHQQQTLSLEREDKAFRIFRTNSISSSPSDEYRYEKKTKAHVPLYKGAHRYAAQRLENKNAHKKQIKKFGSEPNLYDPSILSQQDERDKCRGRKKYKAPPPPNSSMQENLTNYRWEEDGTDLNEPSMRRGRLFKTKAELKKKYTNSVQNNEALDKKLITKIELDNEMYKMPTPNICEDNRLSCMSNVKLRDFNRNEDFKNNRLSLPEMHNLEFQAELRDAMQRIKYGKSDFSESNHQRNTEKHLNLCEKDEKSKLKTLDHNISKKDHSRSRTKQIDLEMKIKDSPKEEQIKIANTDKQPSRTKEQPSKLFYFGLNDTILEDNTNKTNFNENLAVDNFAASLKQYNRSYLFPHSSGSDLSSELGMDESQVSNNGIALQLRPILPKKQLEIPRFSPAAAWKLLSAVESNFASSTAGSEDPPIFMEEKIEKLSRPPPLPALQADPRSSYDKSGDSGISGDAGPAPFDDSIEGIVDVRNNVQLPMVSNSSKEISWTPQQDLGEEESSSDDDLFNRQSNRMCRSATPVKFTPKPNVFSLSLPRDNHLASYITSKYNSQPGGLQKIKRSVSGVLGNLASKRDSFSFNRQSENWFLSKSAPNSLNNGFNSLEIQNSQKSEETDQLITANNTQNVSRVMYLPEFENLYTKHGQKKIDKGRIKDHYRNNKYSKETYNLTIRSKSCENISTQEYLSSPEPENLQDPPKREEFHNKLQKPKRFTFQSTIRQIERRRIAEKLSKEAEKKEKQRLGELEAMQRVEEEFQRKRSREKASIRQQLRLYSMDETAWSSLPPNLDTRDTVLMRSEPDGAVSSSTSSPKLQNERNRSYNKDSSETHKLHCSDSSNSVARKTPTTQVLSEYRQMQREYKDFRGSPRYLGDYTDAYHPKQTVHPQVTYNMPKASAQQENENSCNYRKQFAHGVKTSRSGESTYSDDSQSINNRNYSPNFYRNKTISNSRF